MIKPRGVDLKVESSLYEVFENNVSGTGKKVMLSILKLMERDMNQIIIGGKTLTTIMETTGLSEQQVRNKVTELKKHRLIEPTGELRAEYIVSPTFAVKGDENSVWDFCSKIESNKTSTKIKTLGAHAVVLPNSRARNLTEEDYKKIGEYTIKRKTGI